VVVVIVVAVAAVAVAAVEVVAVAVVVVVVIVVVVAIVVVMVVVVVVGGLSVVELHVGQLFAPLRPELCNHLKVGAEPCPQRGSCIMQDT
jgi:hypothetical protein